MPISESVIGRLRGQIRRSELILFYGAGLSRQARNGLGQALPAGDELTRLIWRIAFPGDDYVTTRLQDVYRVAQLRQPKELLVELGRLYTVATESLEDWYRVWFTVPWVRCYTLNIDNLEVAAASRYDIGLPIRSISATSGRHVGSKPDVAALETVHLNGMLGDDLEQLTFSDADYAERLNARDEWLIRCASDIVSRPVIFVGTQLEEPALWQHMEARRTQGKGLRELRPGSCFVGPRLDPARRVVLEDLNIDWIAMDAREFAETVLAPEAEAIEEGRRERTGRAEAAVRRERPSLVSELAAAEKVRTDIDYLLGARPAWNDIKSGRAVPRDCDDALLSTARGILTDPALSGRPIVLSGTSGSGKTSTLMRLGLVLAGEGIATYWLDPNLSIQPHKLRDLVLIGSESIAILVDDADAWGPYAASWLRQLPGLRPKVLFVAAVRSGRIDSVLDEDTARQVGPLEIGMPVLSDSDIERLIASLDKANLLGILKGVGHSGRVQAFRDRANRHLLVAMIEATSGRAFSEKVIDELAGLSEIQKSIYAAVCLVASRRATIDRSELLLALNRADNVILNELDKMVTRGLVLRDGLHGNYAARHRVIADEVVGGLEARGLVGDVLLGLCFAFAAGVNPGTGAHSRSWRRLASFINHDFVWRMLKPNLTSARAIYDKLQGLLGWHGHFWLQRGSLEVESGDLALATNYLDQARSLAGGETAVETEYAYLQMKKAASAPSNVKAAEWFKEGRRTLEALIAADGRRDSVPYHVLGSQGLSWSRRGSMSLIERQGLLRDLLAVAAEGVERHPRSPELVALHRDIKQEWLETTVDQLRTDT